MDGLHPDLAVAHHAVSPLVLYVGGHAGGADAVGQAAAHTTEHRHLRHADDSLCNGRLGREGIDGDDGVGVDILDDGHVCAEHQRLDTASEHTDAAALADAAGHGQRVLAQVALIGRYKFSHWYSFPAAICLF